MVMPGIEDREFGGTCQRIPFRDGARKRKGGSAYEAEGSGIWSYWRRASLVDLRGFELIRV